MQTRIDVELHLFNTSKFFNLFIPTYASLKEVGLNWKWPVIKWEQWPHNQCKRATVKTVHTE